MYAVILAGGGGTRLWPLSRAHRPKPFLPLLPDGRSLLAVSVERLVPLVPLDDIHVVTDARYAELVTEELPHLPPANLLLEPMARNTAAAVALAALAIERPGDEVMLVLPADQSIRDATAFREALRAAASRAATGDMVTLGIMPTGPETGYGYVIAEGDARPATGLPSFRVARFEEKPSPERAAELLATGGAAWNGGIFAWRRDTLLSGLRAHAPEIVSTLERALAGMQGRPPAERDARLADAYPMLQATSIDYALLEPASLGGRVAVVPAPDLGWSDVGSWTALRDLLVPPGGTASVGPDARTTLVIDGSDVLIHAAGGRLVAVLGLSDAIVVDTPDALLICAGDAAQQVRSVVDRLAGEGRSDLL